MAEINCLFYYDEDTTWVCDGLLWINSFGEYADVELAAELKDFHALVAKKEFSLQFSNYFDTLREKNSEIERVYDCSKPESKRYSNGIELVYEGVTYVVDGLRWTKPNCKSGNFSGDRIPVSLEFNDFLYDLYIKKCGVEAAAKADEISYISLKAEADMRKSIFDSYHDLLQGVWRAESGQYYLIIPATEAAIFYSKAIERAERFSEKCRDMELRELLPKMTACYRNSNRSCDAISFFEYYFQRYPHLVDYRLLNSVSASYSDEKKFDEAFACFKWALELRRNIFDLTLDRTGMRMVRESFDREDSEMRSKLLLLLSDLKRYDSQWKFGNGFG